MKLGKFSDMVGYDKNMMFFDQMSGVELNFGSKDFKAQIRAGRISEGDTKYFPNGVANSNGGVLAKTGDTANIQSIALTYSPKKFSITGAYYHLTADWFKNFNYSTDGNTDKANIWEIAGSYRFDKNVALAAAYARNGSADYFAHSHMFQLDYKGAKPANQGTWGAHVAYRYLGANTSIDPSTDGILGNTKGWEVGFAYVPLRNIQLRAIYSDGKDLATDDKSRKLFGRCEWFF